MSDVDNKVKMIVEGLLLAAGKPLSLDSITKVFSEDEKPDKKELLAVMEAISKDCNDRGFELKQVASGYRFQVKQELSEWIGKLWEEKPPRYTRALLETLALIAYRQPITRGDIEEIRGVGVSPNIMRTLLDREWVRVVGHRDVPGRPAMFATTRQFLDYFNLKSLEELPPLSEIKELGPKEPEIDLGGDLANLRILDLPEETDAEGEVSGDDSGDDVDLLAEQEAVELSKKPLDEILKMGVPEHLLEEEPDQDEETEDDDSGAESGDDSTVSEAVDEGGVSEEEPESQQQHEEVREAANEEEAANIMRASAIAESTVVEPSDASTRDEVTTAHTVEDPDTEPANEALQEHGDQAIGSPAAKFAAEVVGERSGSSTDPDEQ